MVHKKSEYRLQFHSLTQDLRKQIWQDNIRFRESRRSVNQAHHYWSYQITDEPCECDDLTDEKNDRPQGCSTPVLESLEKQNSIQGNVQESTLLSRKNKNSSQRQVRLIEPDFEENFAHEVAVQTPEWEQEEKVVSNQDSTELQHLMKNLSTSPETRNRRKEHSSPRESGTPPAKPQISVTQTCQRPLSGSNLKDKEPNHERLYSSHSSDDFRKRGSPSRFSSLSKTSRKCFLEEKKIPFASYGWNDADKDIGRKKTYNVNAPESEVYYPALRAQKRRREDIEKYLRRESDLCKRAQQDKSPVNLSSIWMSEYQEQFSRGANLTYSGNAYRPSSAPIYQSWRCR